MTPFERLIEVGKIVATVSTPIAVIAVGIMLDSRAASFERDLDQHSS